MTRATNCLLILGASVRAAGQSAARAGFTPICGDLFGDADLRSQSPDRCHVARRYPHDLEHIALECPAGPWIFTGGLENQPALVGRISAKRRLYGNPPEVLRRVRDPFVVGRSLAKWGNAYPECRPPSDPPPDDGGWLLKHRRSSGGQLVRVWGAASSLPRCGRRSGWYFQRRVTGVSCGAVYVAASGEARLIGVTEQLLSAGSSGPFRYAGSLGPWLMSARQQVEVVRVGQALAAEFQLRGLFGVDLVIDGQAVWPIEINPRYTASIEVLERAMGVRTIALHVAACEHGRLFDCSPRSAAAWCGKLVVYAPCELCVSAEQSAELLRENDRLDWPRVADIPVAGTRLRAGQPAVTVLAEAESRDSVLALLAERRRHVERNLFRSDCG